MDYWVNKKEKLKATKLLRQIEEMANASVWRQFVQCTIVLGNWGFQINWWIELFYRIMNINCYGIFFLRKVYLYGVELPRLGHTMFFLNSLSGWVFHSPWQTSMWPASQPIPPRSGSRNWSPSTWVTTWTRSCCWYWAGFRGRPTSRESCPLTPPSTQRCCPSPPG